MINHESILGEKGHRKNWFFYGVSMDLGNKKTAHSDCLY